MLDLEDDVIRFSPAVDGATIALVLATNPNGCSPFVLPCLATPPTTAFGPPRFSSASAYR